MILENSCNRIHSLQGARAEAIEKLIDRKTPRRSRLLACTRYNEATWWCTSNTKALTWGSMRKPVEAAWLSDA